VAAVLFSLLAYLFRGDGKKFEPAILAIGSDDGIQVWLNGQKVHQNLATRALTSKKRTLPWGRGTLAWRTTPLPAEEAPSPPDRLRGVAGWGAGCGHLARPEAPDEVPDLLVPRMEEHDVVVVDAKVRVATSPPMPNAVARQLRN
jgi:hypothetical protein